MAGRTALVGGIADAELVGAVGVVDAGMNGETENGDDDESDDHGESREKPFFRGRDGRHHGISPFVARTIRAGRLRFLLFLRRSRRAWLANTRART